MGDVAGDIAVVIALHDFQVGPEGGQVDGGRALADAAASLLDGLPGDIGGGGEEAPVAGAPAYHFVVGKFLPRHEHLAVEELGRQGDVLHPVLRTGDVAGTSAQDVLVEVGLQILHRPLGLGDDQGDFCGFAPVQSIKGGLGGLGVKGDAGALLLELFGLLIKDGILHLGLHLAQDFVELQLLGQGLGQGHGELGSFLPQGHHFSPAHALEDLTAQALPVQQVAGDALVDLQGGLPQLPGALHRLLAHGCVHLVQDFLQLVALPIGGDDIRPGDEAFQIDAPPRGKGAVVAQAPGLGGGGGAVGAHAGQGDLDLGGLPVLGGHLKLHPTALLRGLGFHRLGHHPLCFGAGHASHGHPLYAYVGIDGIPTPHGAQGHIAHQQGRGHRHAQHQCFFLPREWIVRLIGLFHVGPSFLPKYSFLRQGSYFRLYYMELLQKNQL